MKKLYTISTALLLLAGTFTSCTKDLDEVGLNATSINAAKKEVKATNSNQKVDGGLTLNVSNSNPVIGENVIITAFFTENVTAGTLRIDQLQADGVTWEKVATSSLSSSVTSVSYTFTSNTTSSHTFRGFFTPTNQSNFSQDQTAPATVTFKATCTGTSLAAQLVNKTTLESGLTEYKVAFTLTSCNAYSNVKLQGGVSATIEGNVVATSEDGSEVTNIRYNNKNAVVTWSNLSLTNNYSNTFYVTFRMEKANKDKPVGDWTVEANGQTIASATL